MDTKWYFYALGLVGFGAFLRQVLIRRLGWSERRSGWTAFFLPPSLVCAEFAYELVTEWRALNSGGGLALLAIPPVLIGSLLISAVGVGLSRLLDLWPEIDS